MIGTILASFARTTAGTTGEWKFDEHLFNRLSWDWMLIALGLWFVALAVRNFRG